MLGLSTQPWVAMRNTEPRGVPRWEFGKVQSHREQRKSPKPFYQPGRKAQLKEKKKKRGKNREKNRQKRAKHRAAASPAAHHIFGNPIADRAQSSARCGAGACTPCSPAPLRPLVVPWVPQIPSQHRYGAADPQELCTKPCATEKGFYAPQAAPAGQPDKNKKLH